MEGRLACALYLEQWRLRPACAEFLGNYYIFKKKLKFMSSSTNFVLGIGESGGHATILPGFSQRFLHLCMTLDPYTYKMPSVDQSG